MTPCPSCSAPTGTPAELLEEARRRAVDAFPLATAAHAKRLEIVATLLSTEPISANDWNTAFHFLASVAEASDEKARLTYTTTATCERHARVAEACFLAVEALLAYRRAGKRQSAGGGEGNRDYAVPSGEGAGEGMRC